MAYNYDFKDLKATLGVIGSHHHQTASDPRVLLA